MSTQDYANATRIIIKTLIFPIKQKDGITTLCCLEFYRNKLYPYHYKTQGQGFEMHHKTSAFNELAKIHPEQITSYLESNGWKKYISMGNLAEVWTNEKKLSDNSAKSVIRKITVILDENHSAYNNSLLTAVNTLQCFEDGKMKEIVEDIARPNVTMSMR
jgi:hypothetical protein